MSLKLVDKGMELEREQAERGQERLAWQCATEQASEEFTKALENAKDERWSSFLIPVSVQVFHFADFASLPLFLDMVKMDIDWLWSSCWMMSERHNWPGSVSLR